MHRKLVKAALVGLLAGGLAVPGAAPAAAHDPTFCGHYSYRNGGWHVVYEGYFNSGSYHHHVYAHYYNEFYQHRRYPTC